MTTLTITLSETQRSELERAAKRLGVSEEDLIRASISELLSKPEAEFERTVSYVLQKNAELYRRLA
jgi:hypothetical protein